MEQEQISSIPADGDKNTETSYGKFKSAEELLKAYNALESEFTKRSQKRWKEKVLQTKQRSSRANILLWRIMRRKWRKK